MSTLIKLLHPIVPFITQNLWNNSTIWHIDKEPLESWPKINNNLKKIDIEWLKDIISAIRNIRSELQVTPNKSITVIFNNADEKIKSNANIIQALCKITEIIWNKPSPQNSSTATVGDLKIFIPIDGLIDVEFELQRIDKAISKINKSIEPLKARLDNSKYLESAPKTVVAKSQDEYKKLQKQHHDLIQKKTELSALSGSDNG